VKETSYPCNNPSSPIGLWEVEAPTYWRQSAQMAVRLSALRGGRPFAPRKIKKQEKHKSTVCTQAVYFYMEETVIFDEY
jgi:hypothetical protein